MTMEISAKGFKHHSHKLYGYCNGKVCVLLKVRYIINSYLYTVELIT